MKAILLFIISISSFPIYVNIFNQIEEKESIWKSSFDLTKEKDSITLQLNLSSKALESIPDELSNYTALENLDLSGNRQLEIDQSFYELAKIKTLKAINLSDCQLAYIPFSISEINNLEVLDLSKNYLFEIPDMMHKMHQLKHVDLSQNDLKELGYAPSLWKNLKTINLKDNPNLNMENAFQGLSYLDQLESVSVNKLSHLPENTALLSVKELVFEDCKFKESAVVFPENSQIKSVVFDGCKKTKFDQVLPSIATNKKLEELKLIDNNLKHLVIDSIQFPNLKLLDLRGNTIDRKDLESLRKQFPNCKIEDGSEENKSIIPEKRAINPPIQEALITPEKFVILPEKAQTLTTSSSKITIPQDAFIDKQGKVITTPVTIAYKEILNPVDQILSGIPMEYDSAGVTYNFESAGMIEFRAESEGKEVFPNPKALINVELNSEYTDTDYGVYSMDNKTGKWSYINPAVQVQNNSNSDSVSATTLRAVRSGTILKYPVYRGPSKPTIGYKRLEFYYNNDKKNRVMVNKDSYRASYTHILKNRSLNFILKSKIQMEEKEWKRAKKEHKRYYKRHRAIHKIDSTDLFNNICFGYDFTVNKEKDMFDLTINYIDTALTVQCRLKNRSNSYAEQKGSLRFWVKYQKEKKREYRDNQKVIRSYVKAMNAYEKELKAFQIEVRDFTEKNKDILATQDKVFYTLQMSAFTSWNCDRISRLGNRAKKVKAVFNTIGKKAFVPVIIYIINKTKNGYLRGTNVTTFKYEAGCEHSILLMDEDGNAGIVNEESFRQGIIEEGVKKHFDMEVIAKDDISRKELLSQLL